jgi:hypothetical protein
MSNLMAEADNLDPVHQPGVWRLPPHLAPRYCLTP